MKLESKFSDFFDSSSKDVSVTNSYFRFSLGFILLGLVFSLPSGIIGWFDGLPWTGKVESLTLAVIVPILLFLGFRFLALRQPILILAVLLIFKTVLFFGSPSSGWQIKIIPNVSKEILINFWQYKQFLHDEIASKVYSERYTKKHPFQASERDAWMKSFMSKDGNWAKTYATLWNENVSGILQNPWINKLDFPLDWFMIGNFFTVIGVPNDWELAKLKCPSPPSCLDDLSPIVSIKGALLLPKGESFALIAEGVKKGAFMAVNEGGESIIIPTAKSFQEAVQGKYQLRKDGRWRISAKIFYEGATWSLIPLLIESNGKITEGIGRDVLWQNGEDLSKSQNHISFYKVLSFILDGGIIIFLLTWTVWIICSLIKLKLFNLNFSLFCILATCTPFLMSPLFNQLLKSMGKTDITTVSYLGFSFLFVILILYIFSYWKNDYHFFQPDRIVLAIFLFFVPATLVFFAHKWWYLLEQRQILSYMDDWSTKQFLAYKIFVEGDWLRGGGYTLVQPLYSYFIGLYHWLFGQSNFAQHMADVWCVLLATIILSKLMLKFRFSTLTIFIICTIYLSINFIGTFRYHLGRSLNENHAMLFMMLAAWFVVLAREGGTHRIILAAIFGSIGFWIRMDHLLVIAGLGLLIYEPVLGPRGGWNEYWGRFKLNWTPLAWYWGGGGLSILVLSFRNWWLGGSFMPYQGLGKQNSLMQMTDPFQNLYVVFSARSWEAFPSFSIPGYFLISGMLIAVLALVWRSKIFLNYPLSLSISMLGLLPPYIAFTTLGYAPRFSIHFLPLAIFSISFLLNNLVEKYELLSFTSPSPPP